MSPSRVKVLIPFLLRIMTLKHDPLSTPSALKLILWEEIFVVVDRGRARPHEYAALRVLISEQAARFPNGIGCLAIIPPDAKPPSDAAREALNAGLASVSHALRCMCWLVEGDGFQGAMVRAVLTGVRLVGKLPYATHVTSDLTDAVAWCLVQLRNPSSRARDVVALACEVIVSKRVDASRAPGGG